MIDPEVLKQLQEADDPGDFVIDHKNWRAWEIFSACGSQWRISPGGQVLGLDYQAVFSVMKIYGKVSRKLFNQIQLIERGARMKFAKQDIEDVINAP